MKNIIDLNFSPVEIRVLGCLIEKQHTTPDSYPLTLNSLTHACTQKTSRDPVMPLSEADVLEATESLIMKTLVSSRGNAGNRVTKYSHRLYERRTNEFNFSTAELAVLCVLLLRGPQTPGEIRTRCTRIYHFQDMAAMTAVLKQLQVRPDGPYVKQLAHRPGQKEARYMHLFGDDTEFEDITSEAASQGPLNDEAMRLNELECHMNNLKQQLLTVEQRLNDFIKQFG